MILLIEQLLNGLQFGVFLFLVSAGLTLIFGIMGVINLAHGSLYMVGAYATAIGMQWTGSFWWGLLMALPAAAFTGWLVELVIIRQLYRRDHLDQVLATFGLILFLNELTTICFGRAPLFLSLPETLSISVDILPGLLYPLYRLLIIGTGLLLAFSLYLLISHTRAGMLLRAGTTHREMVEALGVNLTLLNTGLFVLGALLAGFAGALAGPLISVEVGMGENVLILCFVCIVIGGLGSIRGALFGALLIGMLDTQGRAFLASGLRLILPLDFADSIGAALSSMSVYLLMALVLIFEARLMLGVGFLLIGFPWFADWLDEPYLVSTASRIWIYALAAMSLNLLVGFAGLVSFGHSAYVGVGAYVVGILAWHQYEETKFLGLPGTLEGFISIPFAMMVSGIVALGIGALCLRTRGIYFIMITLAFAQMLFYFFVSLEQYGGDDGLMMMGGRNKIPGLDLGEDRQMYWLSLVALGLATWFLRRLSMSRFGLV